AVPHRQGRIDGTIQDITEKRRNEERIRFLAYYDPVTQLPNRNHLKERLQRLIARAGLRGETLGLLCIDLQRFRRVNDTPGRQPGDELLRQVAARLVDSVRATDWVGARGGDDDLARIGDEFAVILPNIGSEQSAVHASRRLLRALHRPFWIGEHEISLQA